MKAGQKVSIGKTLNIDGDSLAFCQWCNKPITTGKEIKHEIFTIKEGIQVGNIRFFCSKECIYENVQDYWGP